MFVGSASAAVVLLAASVSLAQAQSLSGCWSQDSGGINSRICFEDNGGTIKLDWALQDDTEGWSSGNCSGFLSVQRMTSSHVSFTVPRQNDACFQNGATARLALRTYDCVLSGENLVCSVNTFYDDGTLFRSSEGVRYHR